VLESRPRGESFRVVELFERQRGRRAMICLFLAILEMVKLQAVVLAQTVAFGDIVIKRHKKFAEAFASGQALSVIEKDYR
jgi:segregation and condensation protein A